MLFLEIVLPEFLVFLLGFLIQRKKQLDLQPFVWIALYVFNPALAFKALYQSSLAWQDFAMIVVFGLLIIIALLFISWVTARIQKLAPEKESAFLLSTVFMNVGNYGLPVVYFAFGDQGVTVAIVFMVLFNFLNNSLGVYLAARGKFNWQNSLGNVLRMPTLYAAVLGLSFYALGLSIPDFVLRPVELMAQAAIPSILLLLGMQLAAIKRLEALQQVTWGTIIRLIISPLLALLIVGPVLNFPGLTAKVLVLEAAMPTAVNTTLLALHFDTCPEMVISIALVTTICSVLTLPVLLFFLI